MVKYGLETPKKIKNQTRCGKCFTNGQKIRHTVTNTWTVNMSHNAPMANMGFGVMEKSTKVSLH